MELLALTIAPRIGDEPINSVQPQVAYWEQRRLIHRLLQRCSKEFKMIPEFSDNGHLHWHGYLYLHDTHKWFMQVLPTISKRIGFIKVVPVREMQKWLEYCCKDLQQTSDLLKDLVEPDEKVYIDSEIKLKRKYLKGVIETNAIKTLLDYGFIIN